MRAIILLIALKVFTLTLTAQKIISIGEIKLKGNDRTKDVVILRELRVKSGDQLPINELEAIRLVSIQNLTNTGLFNFVYFEWTTADSNTFDVQLTVEERWYFWPGIIYSLAETNLNSWWVSKDFDRINYGFYLQDLNFRGRREKLTFIFQNGWTRKMGITYQLPGINRNRTLGSGFEISYANNREVNISSVNNERIFLKQNTFILEEFALSAKIEYRPKYFNLHRFVSGFQSLSVRDTIRKANPLFIQSNGRQSQFIRLVYSFRREKRDNKAYPLKGYVLDGMVEQFGLGLVRKNDVKLTTVSFMFNMHHKLNERWYFGHGLRGKATALGQPPYYFQRGLGYDNNYIRGYELYVIDGQHYLLYKSNIKFQLIKKRVLDLNMNMLNKFEKLHYSVFLNLFGDAGYTIDRLNASTNPYANSWQYSFGLGMDVPTYYDLVVRFEASLNKQGQFGYFINFRTPL